MAWFKTDDALHSHPKARKAGLHAMGLWIVSGSHAMQYMSDGFVPEWFVASWPQGRKHAASLVSAGLWAVDETAGERGWRFRDWEHYQPTREEIEADKESARERQRRFREARRDAKRRSQERSTDKAIEAMRNGVTNDVTNGVTNDPPLPSRPDPAPSISIETKKGESPKQRESDNRPPIQPCGERHPSTRACRACGAIAEKAKADELSERRANAAEERAATIATKAARIASCDLCDDKGYRGGKPCPHEESTPMPAELRGKFKAVKEATK